MGYLASPTKLLRPAGNGTPEFRIRHTYPTQDAAQKAAHARLEAFQPGKRTLSLTLPGKPDIGAEARLALDGFRAGIAGTWSVTKAVHTLGGSGLVTQVEGEVV